MDQCPGSKISVVESLPISIKGVTKTYGDVYALDQVDIEVNSGDFLTLLGPSGSGKTTLLMALAGFTRPDYGSIKFGGEEVILKPPHLRDVGMVFQNYALFPHMTVAANIAYPLKLRKIPRAEIERRVNEALATVRLDGFGARKISQLSGGQKQRIALARAIVFKPRIVLMDEPLSALDKKLRDHMQIELRQMHDRLGMTTVYVTHDQREALTMSDRIAVINRGRVMQFGAPREIYDNPANKFIADFIGESTFLPLRQRGTRLFFGDQPVLAGNAPETPREKFLVVRPEHLVPITGEPAADMNLFQGTVRRIVYQGDATLFYINLKDNISLIMRKAGDRYNGLGDIKVGAMLKVGLHRDDAVVVAEEKDEADNA